MLNVPLQDPTPLCIIGIAEILPFIDILEHDGENFSFSSFYSPHSDSTPIPQK